jgi:hypothetical protein
MNECKYKETSRAGLYIMVFLIFWKVVCNAPVEQVRKEVERLSIKVDSLVTQKIYNTKQH